MAETVGNIQLLRRLMAHEVHSTRQQTLPYLCIERHIRRPIETFVSLFVTVFFLL